MFRLPGNAPDGAGAVKTKQWLLAVGILAGLFLVLLAVVYLGDSNKRQTTRPVGAGAVPINVLAPGQGVKSEDYWIAQAGREMREMQQWREEQKRLHDERVAADGRRAKELAELRELIEKASRQNAPAPAPLPPPPVAAPTPGPTSGAHRVSSQAVPGLFPPGSPGMAGTGDPGYPDIVPTMTRVSVIDRASNNQATATASGGGAGSTKARPKTVQSFLPISFTRGVLLSGLDAPTGGQSQSNPHPVLIRLTDNAVLPSRFRAEYKECFVVAAGYGELSSERAYLRTEYLSCVRPDGRTMEVKIQGTVNGEDGKAGVRGRLVTKQGQVLANALRAGIVGGIAQGFSTYNSSYAYSAFGSIAQRSGTEAVRGGVGIGVGRALDRLATYYIRLAEQMFPIIEVDAGRDVDVVITKGARIEEDEELGPTAAAPGKPDPRNERPVRDRGDAYRNTRYGDDD